MVIRYAPHAYQLLKGMFPVYKPSGTAIISLANELYDRLLQDLNKMEQRPQKQMIVFKPINQMLSDGDTSSEQPSLKTQPIGDSPVLVPDWFDHPLVVGLQDDGESTLKQLKRLTLPRRYLAQGQFGIATISHETSSKVVDRSTWDHITAEQIDRVLTVMQGVHRNAALKASGVELDSQQAYELACKGLLKPNVPTEAIILDSKLITFKPPHFSIELTCVNESCHFLRRVLHILGYELKSTAVCTHLQRQSDGVITYSDPYTLLGRQVDANNVINSIEHCRTLLDENVLKRKDYFEEYTMRLKDAQLPVLEAGDEMAQESVCADGNEQMSNIEYFNEAKSR